jgi:phosphomannomutase/phosphoglucomutase
LNPHIFREYDIRGIAARDLDDETAFAIARAFAARVREAGARRCLLGWDVRESSPRLKEAVSRGLRTSGLDVIRIGIVPTPVLYFGIHHLGAEAAVMVTGSHNPPDQNGFKLNLGPASLHGEEIRALRKRIINEDYHDGQGTEREHALLDDYRQMVVSRCRPARRLRVVLDSGNGCAGLVAPTIFRELGHEVVSLYEEPDGRFPNHQPDPTVQAYMSELCERVVAEKADLGVGYDGDADRIGVVDESGRLLYGDQLLALLAQDLLTRHPGAKVVYDVKCSRMLEEEIRARGGEPIMWKTGHSLTKAKMKQEGALLAGEMSGHIFFGEGFFGHDDAIYASAFFARFLAGSDLPLSGLREALAQYVNSPEIRIGCSDEAKFRIVDEVGSRLEHIYPVVKIDGVRATIGGGWGLLRASNTQPVLVLRFEASSEGELDEIVRLFRAELARFPEVEWGEAEKT